MLGDVVSALRAIGEHHNLAHHGRRLALDPALAVESLFVKLSRHSELRAYPVWNDSLIVSDPMQRPSLAAQFEAPQAKGPFRDLLERLIQPVVPGQLERDTG